MELTFSPLVGYPGGMRSGLTHLTVGFRPEEGHEHNPYQSIVDGCMVALILLLILGTVGNVLSVVTLCTRGLRHQATSTCLVALAISDILVLFTSFLRFRAYYPFLTEEQYLNSKFEIEDYLDVYVEPFYWMALGMTSFIITLVTAERFLAIRFPFWVRRHWSRRRHVVTLVAAVMVPVLLTMPSFFYYQVEEVYLPFLNRTAMIAMSTEFGRNDKYRCVYLQYLIPFLWYVIPWLCLAVLNTLLLRHVKQSARVSHRNHVSSPSSLASSSHTVTVPSHSSASQRHSRNLTLLLVVLVLTYMVCNLPKCVLVFIRLIQESSEDLCEPGSQGIPENPQTPQQAAEWVVSVFNIANSAVNFLLYCVLGHKFRAEFSKALCPCCKCCKIPHVAPFSVKGSTMLSTTYGHSAI